MITTNVLPVRTAEGYRATMAWVLEDVVERLKSQLRTYGLSGTLVLELQAVRLNGDFVEVWFSTSDGSEYAYRHRLSTATYPSAEGAEQIATVVRTNLTEQLDAADRGLPEPSAGSRTWWGDL